MNIQEIQDNIGKREYLRRAWCEGKHGDLTFAKPHMEYDITIVNGMYAYMEADGYTWRETYPRVPIMQGIGRKDRNGRAVFNGDILGNFKLKKNIFPPSFPKSVVVYWNNDESQYWIRGGKDGDFDYDITILEAYEHEIIGNIFENPEFFKKQ